MTEKDSNNWNGASGKEYCGQRAALHGRYSNEVRERSSRETSNRNPVT
jgi:hypothetical protein